MQIVKCGRLVIATMQIQVLLFLLNRFGIANMSLALSEHVKLLLYSSRVETPSILG